MNKPVFFHSALDSRDNFVGAKLSDSKVDFYFPLGIEFDEENSDACLKEARKILNVLFLAAPSSATALKSLETAKDSRTLPLNSCVWLIEDYLKNGLYLVREKTFAREEFGKINWRRTFKAQPLPARNSFVYLKPVIEKRTRTDNFLTEIQKYCLDLSLHEIGWLFNLPEPKNFRDISRAEKVYFENLCLRELKSSFDDRKKILINHLLRILRFSLGKKTLEDFSEVGTYEFHQVWESMIDKVFGTEDQERFFPSASWILADGEHETSKLRPDTVMRLGINLYILDAKYYKFGVTKNPADLPSSGSIQKQITYGDHARHHFGANFREIKNAFLLPTHNPTTWLEYKGFAKSNWLENNKEYQKIHLLLLNTNELIKLYLSADSKVPRKTLATLVDNPPEL